MIGGVRRLHEEIFPAFFVLGLDRDASTADYREEVSDIDIWSLIFVRGGFVGDDTLVSFLNKLTEAKLGDSSRNVVRWDLTPKRTFQSNPIVRSSYN